MKAIAPGKLILSGEHAVVYGRPALAMAIDRFAQSVVTAQSEELISFNLLDLSQSDSFTLRTLREMRNRVQRNYRQFLRGELSIREVLHKPIELFEFAFINILDGLHLKVAEGLNIQTRSDIPIGCGLGSSAATVLSVLRGIGHYLRVDFRPDWYMKYSLEAEQLQHGHPSGVDSYISLHGGAALFQGGEATAVPLPRGNLYLVNTGTPASTTGECVVHVRSAFRDDPIWNDFEAVTRGMEASLRRNDEAEVRTWVRENQRLLERIGVVPPRVRDFVRELEAQGVAAKICGAGSVAGEAGGIVLVLAETPPVEVCRRYGFEVMPVRGDPLGVRIV